MARLLDELLDEHPVVAEACEPLALGRLEAFADVGLGPRQSHALAAAAGARLHHHRVADFAGDAHRVLGAVDLADEARHHRDARRLRQLFRFDLVAHRRNGIGGRPDEDDPRCVACGAEAGALAQEAIARVHRPCAGSVAGGDNRIAKQIGFGRRGRSQSDALVGHLDVQRARICIRIDCHGGDSHGARGADDTGCDLATVSDQDFFKHARRSSGDERVRQAPRVLVNS